MPEVRRMITLWQGSCNQWDCDEMGHMNVRVYAEKQMEGLAAFTHDLKLSHAFKPDSPSTIIPVDQHIRFIREVLAGHPLIMQGCVLEVGECDALIYQELRHSDGALAAAFRVRVLHVDTVVREPFAWSKRTRKAFEDFMGAAPEESAPRSIDASAPTTPAGDMSMERIRTIGAPLVGKGSVPPSHMDVHGHMAPFWITGRVSDSVPNLLYNWRKEVAGELRIGGAALEHRIRYHAMPQVGDRFEMYTSFGAAAGKTHSLIHWLMNPDSGRPWASVEVTAIALDLDARKAVPAPPEMIAKLSELAPPGLKL